MAYHGKYPYRINYVSANRELLIVKDNAGHRILIAGEALRKLAKAMNHEYPKLGEDIRQVSRIMVTLNIRTH